MINIADNPAVLQQLTAASKAVKPADPASEEHIRHLDDASRSAAYPAAKLELIDGRYRVTNSERQL
jgi:hypothetical protein